MLLTCTAFLQLCKSILIIVNTRQKYVHTHSYSAKVKMLSVNGILCAKQIYQLLKSVSSVASPLKARATTPYIVMPTESCQNKIHSVNGQLIVSHPCITNVLPPVLTMVLTFKFYNGKISQAYKREQPEPQNHR